MKGITRRKTRAIRNRKAAAWKVYGKTGYARTPNCTFKKICNHFKHTFTRGTTVTVRAEPTHIHQTACEYGKEVQAKQWIPPNITKAKLLRKLGALTTTLAPTHRLTGSQKAREA
jgi:hypothetical protein